MSDDPNKKLFDHAYAWMQHCSEQAEYFDLEGEDDTA